MSVSPWLTCVDFPALEGNRAPIWQIIDTSCCLRISEGLIRYMWPIVLGL